MSQFTTLNLEKRGDMVFASIDGAVAARESAIEAAVAVLTAKDPFAPAEPEVPAIHFDLSIDGTAFVAKEATKTFKAGDPINLEDVRPGMKITTIPGVDTFYRVHDTDFSSERPLLMTLENSGYSRDREPQWYSSSKRFTLVEDFPAVNLEDVRPAVAATYQEGIKRLLHEAAAHSYDAVISGTREDGTGFEKRLVEVHEVDGGLLRTWDYLTSDYRSFRIDRLTRVSIEDVEVEDAQNQF
jgi:hypothetical protein